MKERITLIFITFIAITAFSIAKDKQENLQSTIDLKYSADLISRFDKAFNTKQDPNNPISIDVTHLFAESVLNWSRLSADAKKSIEKLQDGTDDLDFPIESPKGFFVYHCTDLGENAISFDDKDKNDIPDIVDFYDSCFTNALDNYLAAGYPKPPVEKYHVYMSNTACPNGVLGFCSITQYDYVGNNPNSTVNEVSAYKSSITIRTNFGYNQDEHVKNTSCHELFHAIQFGIDVNTLHSMFIMEGGAVWSQHWNYKDSYMGFGHLYQYFRLCDLQLNYEPDDSNDENYLRPYGTWIFFQYLTDLYGDDFIRKLYINFIGRSQNEAFEKTFKDLGTDYVTVLKNFFISQIIMPKIESTKPIYWSFADMMTDYLYPEIEMTFNTNSGVTNFDSNVDGNKRFEMMSADYFSVTGDYGFDATIQNTAVTDTFVLAVIKADKQFNPTKFDYKEVKIIGKNSAKLSLNYSNDMPFMSIAVINIKKANYKGVSCKYKLTVAPNATTLNVNDNSTSDRVYPNPAKSIINVDVNTKTDELYQYKIYSAQSSLVLTGEFTASNSKETLPINIEGFYPGAYMIQITNSNQTESKYLKFVVQ